MPVDNINQDISNDPFTIPGKSTGTSNPLNMAMNLEPAAVALLLRTLAVQVNLDTRALDALLGLGGLVIRMLPQTLVFLPTLMYLKMLLML
jgi:hypothetical protein